MLYNELQLCFSLHQITGKILKTLWNYPLFEIAPPYLIYIYIYIYIIYIYIYIHTYYIHHKYCSEYIHCIAWHAVFTKETKHAATVFIQLEARASISYK